LFAGSGYRANVSWGLRPDLFRGMRDRKSISLRQGISDTLYEAEHI